MSDPTVKEQRKKAKATRAAAKPAARLATSQPGGLWFALPAPTPPSKEEIEAGKKMEKPKREKFTHDLKMV